MTANERGAGPDTTRTSPHTQDAAPTAKQGRSRANGSGRASASAALAAVVRDIGGRRHDADAPTSSRTRPLSCATP